VSRTARNKRKQPAFANKFNAHRACRCGGIAKRDEGLAVFVLQNNSTADKGVQGGGRSQGKQRSAAPPATSSWAGAASFLPAVTRRLCHVRGWRLRS